MKKQQYKVSFAIDIVNPEEDEVIDSQVETEYYDSLADAHARAAEYHVKIDELRKLLCIQEKYTNKQLMQSVIAPAVKELQKDFPLLNCETTRARTKGRPLTAFHFTFDVDGQIPGQTTIDEAQAEMEKYKATKTGSGRKKNSFNDFEQRKIDFDDLERRLIRQDSGEI